MRNFENLNVWKKSVELAKRVLLFIREQNHLQKVYALADQIQRSAISIASNIAEGADRSSDKEFVRFLVIARGSAAELKTQIIVAKDAALCDETASIEIIFQIEEVHKMINGLIQSILKKP